MGKRSKGDLIRYIYHEMDSLESRMFEKTLENEPALQRECTELKEASQLLEGLRSRPGHQVLKNILAYAAEAPKPGVTLD